MNHSLRIFVPAIFAIALSGVARADPETKTNLPSECDAPNNTCGCKEDASEDKCECEEGNKGGQKDDGTGGEKSANNGDSEDDGCIKVRLGLGRTTPWTGSLPCSLKIFADDDTPEIFTAESLHAVLGGYTFKRLGQRNMADGETPKEVVFSHPNGESVTFVFAEGESWGRPNPGVHGEMDERVLMVDAEGWAVTNAPVYYDLYVGDGTRRRFLATDMTGRLGALVSITNARGVTNTPEEMGADVVYTPAGVRQFLTPSFLANVTYTSDWQGYDVAVYALGDAIPAKDEATGLYELPAANPVKNLSIRREDGGKRARVTVTRGGGEPKEYIFDYLMGDWSLIRPSGVRKEKVRMVADSKAAQILSSVHEPSGKRLSRTESNFKWMSWGFAMTNRVEGFGGVTETTTWTYYTGGNGKGLVKTELRQSGLLAQYAYDAEDRVVSETRSGPGMMAETTTYSYASVDPSDFVPPVDKRPRTVVKTLDGVECRRTYYVYSPLTNIVERVGEPGAAYGGTNALRTVTAYWPASGGPGFVPAAGFVKSVRHEDGKLDLYDYSLESNLWTRTVTHLHECAPEPVDGRATRDITVTNRRSETLETRTEAFVGGTWRVVARETRVFDVEGRIVRRENLAGQAMTTAWDCCHKVAETQPDGSTTTWDYDVDGRMTASSKLIPIDMTNVTWLTTCHEYDGLGRQTATWQTNYAAQVGTPATRIHYDALGRIAARTDEHGNTATIAYSADGLTVTATAANGATTTHTLSAGGDTLSIAGSAVTPEFHAYGILPHGIRWSRTALGETADSPRFTKRYENMLGQTIREERSGFRGVLLATTHEHDNFGHLIRTVADGEPTTEYAYDALGDRIGSCRSVDGPSASWRRTSTHSSFAILDGSIWLVSTNTVSCSDASIAPLVTSTARQLTGLLSVTPARSLSTDIRGNVTENTLQFNAPFFLSTQSPPHAANDQFSITRYGVELQTVSVSCVTNTFAYDSLGRKVATTDGRGNTTHAEFNAAAQQTAAIDALGNRTEYAYDTFGNLSSVTDPLGNATVYEYDLRGRKTYEGGATYPVRYTYDIFGNMTSMMTYRDESLGPDSGDVTTWLHDEASGVMTNKVYADGKGPTYDYTPNGRLSRRTWARGITTGYAYDGWGNLTNTVYSDDTPTVALAYDAMGRQTEAHDAAGTTTFAYDAYGSLTNETVVGVTGTNTIERHWDEFGRTAGYALNGERQTTIGYDSATGRITSMLAAGANMPFAWSYLPGSDLKSSLAYPNGLTASWQYDDNNQLLQVCNATPTNVISQYDYTYDAAGRRISCRHSGSAFEADDTISYGYNLRGELTNAVATVDSFYRYSYQYDDNGNRLWSLESTNLTVYVANCLNQYTAISTQNESDSPNNGFVPQYDDDGNQTFIQTDTGIWCVTYNGENRPVAWSNGATNIVMVYDRMGRRVAMDNHSFVYDDFLQIADADGTKIVWAPTELIVSKPLSWMLNGVLSYYFHDGNKNISDVVGTDIVHYNYAPFGHGCCSATTDLNPFRFSSEYADDKLGLVYFNYRHYDCICGRWTNSDPIDHLPCSILVRVGPYQGKNQYLLVHNRPIFEVDALGLTSVVSDQKYPGAHRVGNKWWLYVDDGQSGKVDLIRYSRDKLRDEMRSAAIQLCIYQRDDGIPTRAYEAGFDTDFFRGENQQHSYYYIDGEPQIWADNEMNYIGIGMYEAWLGSPKWLGSATVASWKIMRWWTLPTRGTFYWFNYGYENFDLYYNELDKCTCRPKDGTVWHYDEVSYSGSLRNSHRQNRYKW